ncbi:MAG: hypothetical protein ONA69_02475 [candidate division KSB1 bacterium]|nr:hypothetical protein [candidate division KSB1 bacterium]MDZ7345637.1 hypothetical protein [candidate division KSB1 bacterium]
MKNGLISCIVLVLSGFVSADAQDLQEYYASAKDALLAADPRKAQQLIGEAKTLLEDDPRLDPNGMFSRRLLPQIERYAEAMAQLLTKLEELAAQGNIQIEWPDLPASTEAVQQYAAIAKEKSEQLLASRSRLLAESDLPSEFREALRQSLPYRQIDRAVSTGIVEQLTRRFVGITSALVDSLKGVNRRYANLSKALEKAKRTPAVSQSEISKLNEQLVQVTRERDKLLQTLAKMLQADVGEDVKPVTKALERQNLETIFTNTLNSEIKYLRSVKEVDRQTYQNLLKGYERLESYNKIFVNTGVAKDKSEQLRELKASIDQLKVTGRRPSPMLFFILLGIVLTVGFLILFRLASKKSAPVGTGSHNAAGHAKH